LLQMSVFRLHLCMIDRIAQRIEYFIVNQSISPKDFADQLGVQRSAISHILSGRNKPSLDFILKMLQAYPEIDQKWLLHGKEQSRVEQEYNNKAIDNETFKQELNPILDLFTGLNTDVKSDIDTIVNNTINTPKKENFSTDNSEYKEIYKSKSIQRVILLYTDGSFDSYEPKNE